MVVSKWLNDRYIFPRRPLVAIYCDIPLLARFELLTIYIIKMTYHPPKLDEKTDTALEQTLSNHVGEIRDFDPRHDAVFGELGDDGPDYRAV